MPTYVMRCDNDSCPRHGEKLERFMHSTERSACKCDACGRALATHPDQFTTIAVQRPWTHGGSGFEGESKAMVFQEEGIHEVLADCPSMDFKVKDGEAIPVFHNDRHHRRVMGELSKAKTRYERERKDEKAKARGRINKSKVMKQLKAAAGMDD